MTNFAIQAYLGYKGLYTYLNWHAFTSTVILRPVLVLAMYFLVGRFAAPESAERYIIGLAAFSIPSALLQSILHSFFFERFFGTFPVLFTARGSRLSIYWSKCVLYLPNAVITVSLCLIFGHLLFGLDLSELDYTTLVAAVAAITAASTTFVMFLGSFCIVTREYSNIMMGGGTLFLALTGAIIPTERLPGPLADIGHVLPLTNGLVAFREAFDGAGLAAVAEHLLLELAVGLGYAVLGYLTFRLLEREAKRRGAFETF